ncbi:MAG TPA: hypothetical protein VJA94_03430 [Candidatus Angelobacter sp.]
MTALSEWQNFYVIVGSSAGALIGLQFVVITLIAEIPIVRDMQRAGAAFSTPTIIHFGAALLLSGVMSAPWHGIAGLAILWGLMGFTGGVYEVIVARRMQLQTAYAPVFEDWLFHVLLPFSAYAILGVSAFAASSHLHGVLFAVAIAALLLLFTGIHNAWDAVTYHVFVRREKLEAEQSREERPPR